MSDNQQGDLSKKINVLIALSLRQLMGDKDFSGGGKRKKGVGDLVQYLNGMGLDAKDIADILGSPVTSVRTLLTPKRRK
ncbi:MAG: hypothetical protein KGL97_06950 [Alphaproteobacteria bacterium]|nr:hypothetical protein [Alphaproteobacteria bacterium]